MDNCIWVTTQFEGFHCYPDAPNEVAFLKNEHRHIFHVKIWIEIFHDDRDIEFFIFKNFINQIIQDNKLDHKSCEMISDIFHKSIILKYPNREVWIEISEDKENGSFKKYRKDK